MAFGRLHEEAAGDGKLLALSDAAFRMWACGLIYCQKNLTDGFIPEHAIAAFGVRGFDGAEVMRARFDHLGGAFTARAKQMVGDVLRAMTTTPSTVADELCRPQLPGRAPVWERVAGGYQVHDYLDWNDSREEILAKREQSRNRRRRHDERGDGNAFRNAFGNADPSASPKGDPNADPNAGGNAFPVVRGSSSSDLQESGSSNSTQDRPGRRLGAGAAGPGASPRDHLRHAFCDVTFSRCVPAAVHDKLANMLAPKFAGDRIASAAALLKWYPTVLAGLPADAPIGDEFRFWQRHFDAEFVEAGVVPARVAGAPAPVSTVPGVAATAKYLD